jgi:hypothetical protein
VRVADHLPGTLTGQPADRPAGRHRPRSQLPCLARFMCPNRASLPLALACFLLLSTACLSGYARLLNCSSQGQHLVNTGAHPSLTTRHPPTHAPAPPPAGSFWGSSFRPGDVLDLSVDQMEALLAATSTARGGGSTVLDNALFAHAESVSQRFFGRDVYYRGIVEFSNVSGLLAGVS